MRAKLLPAGALLAALLAASPLPAAGGNGAGDGAVPAYPAPAVPEHPPGSPRARSVEADVRTLCSSAPEDAVDAAVRRLAGIGAPALPRIAGALRSAPWRARAALLAAVAEMDAPEAATPLLLAGTGDPSFAVREAAVTGLGKTGDARAGRALTERAAPESEPSWRVRSAAAAALRRVILRGVGDRAVEGRALATLLEDPDDDVRRAALEQAAPLALAPALPAFLAAFSDARRPAPERATALKALRAYREPTPELVAALRRGFTGGSEPEEAVRAGRALFDILGVAALDDADVAASAVHHLQEAGAREMREALARLGPPASSWIAARTREAAARAAAGRGDPSRSPFDPLLDALFHVDEPEGVAVLREVLTGPHADELDRETRLSALRRAQHRHAPALASDLRTLLRSPAGRDVLPDVVRAVAASGGDDLGALLDEGLSHPRGDVRSAALDSLDAHPSIPTPPTLRRLAERAERARERMRALSSLARRDPAAAASIAAGLLDHPDPEMRGVAISLLGDVPSERPFERLLRRLEVEDGSAPEPPPRGEDVVPAATTGEPASSEAERARRVLRAALVRALRAADPVRARPVLLRLVASDREARTREAAARALLGLALEEDAATLLRLADADADPEVRVALLRVVATLAGSADAQARFEALVANPNTRDETLRLLAETTSRLAPPALAEGLSGSEWTDEERAAALRTLERAGRVPPPEEIARIALGARTLDLCSEAVRVLAAARDAGAEPALLDLLARLPDAERLSLAVAAVGERRAARALPALLRIFEEVRDDALARPLRTEGRFQLYRSCALALGAIGGDAAGAALAEHLLSPDLAALGGRLSVPGNGPFQPDESGVAAILRTLVAALARFDEPACARILAAALARRGEDGSDLALDKEYLDGVARYLSDPGAYELPPRRRPAAALELWSRVPRIAPRFSPLDAEAWSYAASELETQGRFADAVAAYRASLAVADVEEAARSAEDRLWEAGRLDGLEARAAHAAGDAEGAMRIVSAIRARDPASGDLAFRQGWCLVKLGRPGPEAEEALRFAASRNARDAAARFHLAWVIEQVHGPERSLAAWEEAIRVDSRRVEDLGVAEYLTHRRGRNHRWGHYFYWYAQAVAATGPADLVAAPLRDAILLDDRFAAMALSDPAFASFEDRSAFVQECLDRIPAAPLR